MTGVPDFTHRIFGEKFTCGQDLPMDMACKHFNEEALAEKSREFLKVPIDSVLHVLDEAGRRMTDPSGPYLRKVIEIMPQVAGYSAAMVEKAMEIFREMLSADSLKARLACLGDYRCLDSFEFSKRGRPCRAIPLGSICHISAGNVFIGSVDSLVSGIITKNLNVLKCSRQDMVFPALFFDALEEVDRCRTLSPFLSLTYWSRENAEVNAHIKRAFDAILLFGGEGSVEEYKKGLPARTKLLDFGPKISFGAVCLPLSDREVEEAARGFAMDATLWEQRACTSCQNIFFEGDSTQFCERLSQELEELAGRYPQGQIQLDEAVEIKKIREIEGWESFGSGVRVWEGRAAAFTLIKKKGADIVPSPLNRTIFVNEVERIEEIAGGNLKVMSYYMSTAGVAAPKERLQKVMDLLSSLGVMRFCKPGTMGLSTDDSAPHDGVHMALQLVKLVSTEDLPAQPMGFDFLDADRRDELVLARLSDIVAKALKSPFYREHFSGARLPFGNLGEFGALPPLEKADLSAHTYPKREMFTEDTNRFYIFCSGGTTGAMRHVCYTPEEFGRSAKIWGRGFEAMGITSEDTVANILISGALYTGFLATNRGLEETGCEILSITSNQPVKETIHYLKDLRPTALMGMVTGLVQVGQALDSAGEKLHINKIFYAGEQLPEAGRSLIQRVFEPSVIGSFGYAAVEVGPIGFQCQSCKGTEHHIWSDFCHVDITAEGEVLATTLGRTFQPLIRYRLGDMAEWVNEPCDCGRSAPKLRLLGRMHDYVRVHAGEVYVSEVEAALSKFEEFSSTFQIVVSSDGPHTQVEILAETIKELAGELADSLGREAEGSVWKSSLFLESVRKYGLPEGLTLTLTVKPVQPDSIPRKSRTGKVPRILDLRV